MGNYRTFAYNLALGNHSDENLEFRLMFIYQDMEGTQEVYFADENGNVRLIALAPRQMVHYLGEFSVSHYGTSSGQSIFSVVLVSDEERHRPARLVRRPLGF